jgi:hypothetical protein
MDKPVLIIDAPDLSKEAVEGVQDFLQELMNAIDSHYYFRRKYHEKSPDICEKYFNALTEKDNKGEPF